MTKLGKWLLLLVVACGVYVFFQVGGIMEDRTDIISHRVNQINQALE
jgi:hypothetical protein